MITSRWVGLAGLYIASMGGVVAADVELHPLFRDHMVLQQKVMVPVWGTGTPGEKVSVLMLGNRGEAVTDAEGRWRVMIGPFQQGGPHEMTVEAGNKITVKDVLVGEVWICSGQSNMDWPVKKCMNADEEIANSNQNMIRLFGVDWAVSDKPETTVEGTWMVCSRDSVPGFSAVGYYFARELRRKLKVPVGIIQSSLGATPCQAWTSRNALESDPELARIITEWSEFQAGKAKDAAAKAATSPAAEKSASRPADAVPREDSSPRRKGPRRAPSVLFNAMVHPLMPYRIAGVLWYQGESDTWMAERYKKLFPAMIKDWRQQWGQGDFPFLFVQLPNFGERKSEPGDSEWAELREAQEAALRLPHTGMIVTIDIGEADNIHPANKQEVGLRLALLAEATVYDQKVSHTGPVYFSKKIEGDSIRLRFNSIGGAIGAKDQQELKGFAIAGEDRKFHWAEARIDKGTVVVRSEKVPKPVAVRYAWADNPECNLIGVFQLPAGPFRTDNWPSEKKQGK
jgi:sialate O-acetylesterase